MDKLRGSIITENSAYFFLVISFLVHIEYLEQMVAHFGQWYGTGLLHHPKLIAKLVASDFQFFRNDRSRQPGLGHARVVMRAGRLVHRHTTVCDVKAYAFGQLHICCLQLRDEVDDFGGTLFGQDCDRLVHATRVGAHVSLAPNRQEGDIQLRDWCRYFN